MLNRLKNITGQSVTYGIGGILPKAIGFLLIPLYTNYLSTADYGILSFATTLMGVFSIFLEFGLGNAVTRFHYDYLDNKKEQRSYYGTVWITLTILPLLITIVLLWQGESIFHLLFADIPFSPYGRLALWFSFLNLTSIIPLTLFRVREQPLWYVVFTVGRFLLTTLAIIYFVAGMKRGAEGSLTAQVLATLVFALLFTLISLRNLDLKFEWPKLKASLAFGLPMIPHQLSGWALSVSDRILLARFVTLDQLGIYSLGYRFAGILDIVLSSFNMAWAPFFFRTAAKEKDAPVIFARITTYYAIFVLVLSLGLSLCAKDVIALASKMAYWEAYHIVPVVVLAYMFNSVYYITVNTLFFTKHTKKLPLFTACAAIVNIVLNLIVLPKFGIIAAAWTTAVGYAVSSSLVFWETRKLYPIPYEYSRILKLLMIAGLLYLVGIWLNTPNPYLNLGIKALVVGLFPLGLLITRFFTHRELTGMRLGVQKAQQRLISTLRRS